MKDKYASFQILASTERLNVDFRIRPLGRGTATIIVAPHGGGIEPGTSEIASAIAGAEYSLYLFEGLKDDGNRDLHITSTRFNEPECLRLIEGSRLAIVVHGCDNDRNKPQSIHMGGLDGEMSGRIEDSLQRAGFLTVCDDETPGAEPSNICNRGTSGRGVQLEIPEVIRVSLFASLKRRGREKPTPRLYQLANAIRAVLA